jgi:hypothetical protein
MNGVRSREENISRGRWAIVHARAAGIDTTAWEEALCELIEREVSSWPWMLQEWRRISIPDWRGKLAQARACGRQREERYAAHMLGAVLLDPEFLEAQQ